MSNLINSKSLFTKLAILVLEHMIIFANQLLNDENNNEKINLAPSLLSPALVGSLACMIDEVSELAKECHEDLLELVHLLSRRVTDVSPLDFSSLDDSPLVFLPL